MKTENKKEIQKVSLTITNADIMCSSRDWPLNIT